MKGSILKRTGPQGPTYRVRVELPRDEQGHRRQRSYTYATRRQAERELARLVREIDTGQFADPQRLTVGEYLERWLHDAAKPNLGRRSYARYEGIVRLHLAPTIGGIALAKLRGLHLQGLYRRLQDGGMTAAGIHKVQACAHSAFGQAVRWQMLAFNPADAVTLPKVTRTPVRVLSEAETARLLRAAQVPDPQQRTRLFTPLVVVVATGLRRGELLGLRWCDIDLVGDALSVVQTVAQDGHGVYVGTPKTASSRRRVTLPPFAVAALRTHRASQDEQRLAAGESWRSGDFVFAAVGGGPWAPSNFARSFRALLAKTASEADDGTKIPALACRFHDLRHTHASQLLRLGVHAKVVSERLGHANIGITMNLYAHVMEGLQEDAAQRWDEAMSSAWSATESGA